MKFDVQKRLDINSIFKMILRGSFPALSHKNAPPLEYFYNSYLQTYIDRDLRDIFQVSKIDTFHKFLQLCAARTGQMLNLSDLARDAGISVHAAKEWINILVAGFQIYLLEPYYKNISKRMIKAPRLYFLDTGLAAYLSRWKTPDDLANGAMAGAFFETFVINQIIRSYWFRGQQAQLYYFRDKEGHEVDLIIEEGGSLYPVEIKMAGEVDSSALKNITYLRNKYNNINKGAVISLSASNIPIDRLNEIIPVSFIS